MMTTPKTRKAFYEVSSYLSKIDEENMCAVTKILGALKLATVIMFLSTIQIQAINQLDASCQKKTNLLSRMVRNV